MFTKYNQRKMRQLVRSPAPPQGTPCTRHTVHCRARVEGAHPATGKGNRSGKLRGSQPAPARPGPLGRGARGAAPRLRLAGLVWGVAGISGWCTVRTQEWRMLLEYYIKNSKQRDANYVSALLSAASLSTHTNTPPVSYQGRYSKDGISRYR